MNNRVTNMFRNYCGKETIDTNTYGKSVGHSGSYSTNYQLAGRELLTQDEIRMLDNDKAILMIRGEKPIVDRKYNILKHSNVKNTTDGQEKAYIHGTSKRAKASILLIKPEEITSEKVKDIREIKPKEKLTTELLSEEEIENYYILEDYENERKKENNK